MFGRDKRPETQKGNAPEIVEILERLWLTKLQSVKWIERWLKETADAEIHAGLTSQLVDERRHLRLIGDQVRRLGGKLNARAHGDVFNHLFDQIDTGSSDIGRLFGFYKGVKSYTAEHCSHLIPNVDKTLAAAIDWIVLDEERHLRWADMRIHRLMNRQNSRDGNVVLDRVHKSLESIWGRPWRQFMVMANRRRSA